MGERISKENLDKIIEEHKHWLKEDCPDWETKRADLRGAKLYSADLSGVNLRGADLRDADLYGADLRDAKLYSADLSGADLRYATLYGADLRDADLYGANLSGVNLRDADLRDADLYGVNLRGVNLRGADLSGADLRDADLYGVKLYCAKNVPFIPMACPEVGEFIGWKQCQCDLIVKLKIPETAKRSSATGRKCRCSEAIVLSIETMSGHVSQFKVAKSIHDGAFVYEVGKTVKVDDFCEDRFKECAPGIHFFINRQEAVDYVY
jgi:hypothetical protein